MELFEETPVLAAQAHENHDNTGRSQGQKAGSDCQRSLVGLVQPGQGQA